jgi:hypothetical protein
MKKEYILFPFFLLMICCKKNTCPDGYVGRNDQCICPEGSVETYGNCRPLEENEYYGVLDEKCPCQDSMILKVTLWENNKFSGAIQRGTSWSYGGGKPATIVNDTIFASTSALRIDCPAPGGGNYHGIGGFVVLAPDKSTITFYQPITPLLSDWSKRDTCKAVFRK